MSILARLAQFQGIAIEGGGTEPIATTETMPELTLDTDFDTLRTEVEGAAGSEPLQGQAAADEAARLQALADAAAAEATTTTSDPDPGPGRFIVSTQVITRDGRLILQTIYSAEPFIEEEDLGPAGGGEGGGGPEPPGTTPIPGDPLEEFDAREYAKLNYTWLGDDLIETFLQEFNTNGGDEEEALRNLRTTQAYKDKFPGIFRDDGVTLRIETNTPELDYIKIREDYSNLLQDYNLNPEYFEGQIETLFQNDVSANTFERRLNVAYNTLFPQFDAVKAYYVDNYPNIFPTTEDITDEAIFASFISEDVSADIINQRVNVSQIGGAFREQDFAISTEQAQRLVSAGVTGVGAQKIAARAETQLPRLQRLARRFTGREDIFGLSEFIESEVFGEGVADQVRERLEAEQATAFTRAEGAAATQAGVTGLVEQ